MSVEDFETFLKNIDDLISPQEIQAGHRPVLSNESLALTPRFLATGETFQSLSFQFRISRVVVFYIIKGCCDAIVERNVPIFISLCSPPDEWHKIVAKFENLWNYPHALGAIVNMLSSRSWLIAGFIITITKNTFNHLNGNHSARLRMLMGRCWM